MRPRLQRIDGPHAPGEGSNGLNAAYVISKQSLYRPDLLLTFGKATHSALRDSDLACSMYPHMGEDVYTAHTEGPFHFASYADVLHWGRQILRGNSVDASNPLGASLQVRIALAACKTRGCHGFSSDLVSRIVMS
jgi:hypothetical protein